MQTTSRSSSDPDPATDGDENTAGHDAPVAKPFADFMRAGWAEPARLDVTPDAVAAYAARRRATVSALFPGDWLVVPTGVLKVRANDTDYRFRPGTDFYWLTGCLEPDCVLVLAPAGDGHTATLYAAPRSDNSTSAFYTDRRYGELWVGPRPGLDELSARLGLDTAPLADLPDVLDGLDGARVVRGFDPAVDAALPMPDLPVPAPAEEPAAEPAAEPAEAPVPGYATPDTTPEAAAGEESEVVDPDPRSTELINALSELRLIKDEHEVAMLEQACAATAVGFAEVVRELPQAVATSERWIEGTFYRRARVDGYDVGYDTIAAAGAHACTLHWVTNDGPVRPGDLLLLDAGVESVELYTADITRTLPIDGAWTPAQREVYEVVLRAQEAALAVCRPGEDFLAPHRAAMEVCAHWLADKGWLPVSAEEALAEDNQVYRRYTLHGVSHMLGLDVHDCANARDEHYRKGTLAPGVVLTVEPGLYFQPDDLTVPEAYRGIGVRIEDDILITADGHRNLSHHLPRDPDDIVAWMADLQR